MDQHDISFQPYVAAILKRWPWIVLMGLLAAGLGAGITLLLPQTYTATASALVLVRQTGSQIGTNEQILSIETIDILARRQGLLGLAQNGAIEAQIPPEVIQRIAPEDYRPGQLLQQLRVSNTGDLINITARAKSAEQAKALADAWVNSFVTYANTLYTDQHSQVRLVGNALLPYQPSGPSVRSNTVIAGISGILLAIFLTMLEVVAGRPLLPAGRRSRQPRRPDVSPPQPEASR